MQSTGLRKARLSPRSAAPSACSARARRAESGPSNSQRNGAATESTTTRRAAPRDSSTGTFLPTHSSSASCEPGTGLSLCCPHLPSPCAGTPHVLPVLCPSPRGGPSLSSGPRWDLRGLTLASARLGLWPPPARACQWHPDRPRAWQGPEGGSRAGVPVSPTPSPTWDVRPQAVARWHSGTGSGPGCGCGGALSWPRPPSTGWGGRHWLPHGGSESRPLGVPRPEGQLRPVLRPQGLCGRAPGAGRRRQWAGRHRPLKPHCPRGRRTSCLWEAAAGP